MPDNSWKTVASLVVFVFSIILLTLLTAFAGASEKRIGSGASLAHQGSGFDQTSIITNVNDTASPDQKPRPMRSLLNPNGTVNLATSFRGAVDVSGCKMAIDPKGEPRFLQTGEQHSLVETTASADDVYWDNRFFRTGLGTVYAIVFTDSGLYVGGSFGIGGGKPIHNIARWDGTTWSALGEGVDDTVRGIAVKGNDVYVCGDFLHAGGVEANAVAKWNGTSWSSLGSGISRLCPGCLNTITCIAISGDDVYVGGSFTNAGGVSANGIAKWNGVSWSALGSNQEFGVARSIAVSGTDIYVAGNFGNGVARWDGSNWVPLTSFIAGQAYVITTSGSDVYVGGVFDSISGVPAKNIAKWNGTSWSALGSGTEGQVVSLAVVGSDVYAGLYITLPFMPAVDRIVKWNGTNWSPLSRGVSYDIDNRTIYVFAIASDGTDVYAGGDFILAGGLFARGIAKWNGTAWSVMGMGPSDGASALLADGDDLFVGGGFQDVGGIPASGVAKWNGTDWSPIGSGVRFVSINAIAVIGNKLYVGGEILVPGGAVLPNGSVTSNVAVWDGNSWSVLSTGFSGCSGIQCRTSVKALAVIGTDLYVGGSFNRVASVNVSNIAKWNGANWSAVGTGVDGQINALGASGTDLYAGGFFELAGGANAKGVAKWNGSAWSSLDAGINGAAFALTISGNNLYVGGNFSKAGGVKARNISRWNGSEWRALGDGVDGGVFALAATEGNIYAAGQFATAGLVSAKDIARWNGREWSALGSGVRFNDFPGFGLALAVFKGDLYIGGLFDTAGDKFSSGFARWTGPAAPVPTPKIGAASVSGKKLFVVGENFDQGAVILINGEQQKTANDADNPSTSLIGKKSGKKVKAGDKLRVKNTDGMVSEEFTFSG